MKTPDHHTSKLGSKDFVFQVNKWPFSITCNPLLPTITESYIDLALVKDMKIGMKKVECRNISYGGLTTKLVGSISQTVQIVYNGVANGTMHLKAKVIRNLTNMYGVDCIAGLKLYKTLTNHNTDASDDLDDSIATSESSVERAAGNDEINDDANTSGDFSADDLIYDLNDSPKTKKRKHKNRFMVANLSFSSSMMSSPPPSPRSSSPTAETSQVLSSQANLTLTSPGHNPDGQTRRESPPPQSQNPPQQLTGSILCGDCPPCSCVDTLRAQQQLQLLPAHYPVYLPVDHQPCGQACATLRVHVDNLHPPDPAICACNPPRLQPGYAAVHLQYVPLLPTQDDEPPLPLDFQPCGNYCGFEMCQCLRNYEGRDWAS